MMFSNATERPPVLSESQQITQEAGTLLSRKVWLPKRLYAVVPYFYLVSGIGALFATMYIGHWSWVLPHYLLFSAACLHMGVLIHRRRKGSTNDPK